jgi:hypothetical protein
VSPLATHVSLAASFRMAQAARGLSLAALALMMGTLGPCAGNGFMLVCEGHRDGRSGRARRPEQFPFLVTNRDLER